VKWCATEDGSPQTGSSRKIVMFVLRGAKHGEDKSGTTGPDIDSSPEAVAPNRRGRKQCRERWFSGDVPMERGARSGQRVGKVAFARVKTRVPQGRSNG
jgi:hypothetical protein